MNATRDVITDLLPLYFSGEASADTRTLIEEYFRADPEFERMARRMAASMTVFKATLTEDDALEGRSLMRARAQVKARNVSLGAVISGVVGCIAILLLVTVKDAAWAIPYPLIVLGCVAILAVLTVATRKSDL